MVGLVCVGTIDMNRYLLRINTDMVVDSDRNPVEVCENLYARLSELVQSEDHMLDTDIQWFDMPGNKHEAEVNTAT